MTKETVRHAAPTARGVRDRGTLAGVLLGAAIVVSAVATAQSSSSWFAGLFSTGGIASDSADTTLISQQDSVVATEINAEAANCAQGAPGTIGNAIQTALQVHETLASATPQTESLFDPSGSCFASISQIFDLSFAIPSIASILSAAENAVMQYAQKKVCTAVGQVTGMVTSPINLAISDINKLPGFSDINGMPGNAMSQIDPQLGAQFQGTSSAGGYTANTNPFNSTQTTFTSGSGSASGQLNNSTAQLNALTQQVADQQIAVNQDQMTLETLQNAYDMCVNGNGACAAQLTALQAAQRALVNDQTTLIALQEQLSQGFLQAGTTALPAPAPASVSSQVQVPATSPLSSPSTTPKDGWWSGISKLFN